MLLFFICTVSSGIEDWICIIIISSPFLLMVGIVGWFVSRYLEDADSKKILMIVFLPVLTAPIESVFEDREDHYETKNEIYIQASPTEVWAILLEVPEIRSYEYSLGFYNIIGIPRSVRSEIVNVNGETTRLGYFTDDLILNETVVEYDTLKRMSFHVNLSKSQMRDEPTDQHILKSEIFQFVEISYSLDPVGDSTRLTLTCEYSIKSKMNGYANLWANSIISDFEQRLLLSLKKKLEAHS
ncbi:SRPBCC family protein [Fulvivirga ligni]|uniref:SRPBCC family protein n=1 Tax=Fulvivirga ligni TaxID=2904246 RepID=UPI001F208178|nr:SRPBCC family protein [Fulvivirga ligni]UII20440.1 SRPBCC family protein [Fulvivirga ligni]